MSLAAAGPARRMRVSVLWVLLAGPAMAAEPWTAVVRVASTEDTALLERVRGQSSDLPVRLVTDSGAALEGPAASRWRSVTRLAERHQARAVLWFLREGTTVRVQVAEPASRHLFVRAARLEGQPGSLAWSAGAEALALAARSALRAVDAGAPLGEVVEPAAPEPGRAVDEDEMESPAALGSGRARDAGEGRASSAALGSGRTGESGVQGASPAAPAPVRDGEAGEAVAAPAHWSLTVGAHAALDGYTGGGHQGLLLGVGREWRSLRLGLQLLAGLPARMWDEHTRLSLGQYAGVLWADLPLVSTGSLACAAGLGVGGVGFSRGTEALGEDVEAEPPGFMLALLMGPRVSARWSVSTRLALEASVSAELLLGRPALGYAVDGNFVPRGDGWAVRPRAGVAVVFLP
ncbi:hypothetical protein [Pyxidicoccus fallax]|uniref:hypothetical protein n=1 Tax=Pyxidicoccus fallax TaxID=394095 RepID=UPI001493EC3B|nr:hypothetical protein [Pyxidicoccus fallax]